MISMKRTYTPAKRKKILIVDDDRVVVSAYKSKLEGERYIVEVAGNGEHALRMLATELPDLLILDFSIPGMNGVDVLKAIRSQSGAEALPVIGFTNPFSPILAQAALKAGATGCVAKNDCTPNRLLVIVREVFASGKMPTIPPGVEPGSTAGAALALGNSGRILSAESAAEIQSRAKLVTDFLASAPQELVSLRTGHHAFVNSQKDDVRLPQLFEMHRQARLLAGAAGVVGFRKIAQLASALEALLIQLYDRPGSITPSAIRTIAQAMDLLASLFDQATTPEAEELVPLAILVVDDEAVSREAICSALAKANLAAVSLDDPLDAQRLLEQDHFDLIVLDVEMPGLSGLDLCANIRRMAANRATPVVFITAHADFESRAQSTLSGGDDFIAKPFLSGELAVKALTWLFKQKLQLPPARDLAGPQGGFRAAHDETRTKLSRPRHSLAL
jgi:CheY-like chemotaxis protein